MQLMTDNLGREDRLLLVLDNIEVSYCYSVNFIFIFFPAFKCYCYTILQIGQNKLETCIETDASLKIEHYKYIMHLI